MRRSVIAFLMFSALAGLIISGCDLLDQTVLIDDGEKTTVNDSTTIRLMSSVPDSTHLVLNTDASWHAEVAKGGEWCTISKHDGSKGKDTLFVHVDENPGTTARQTSIVIESGTMILIFRVTQVAAEVWHDIPYWYRTASQRVGLHGTVEKVTITDNSPRNEFTSSYTFDKRGNMLTHHSMHKVDQRFDTVRIYTYDDENHRLTCTVKKDADDANVLREWRYEYGNKGKLVAYSAYGWIDPDPLAEDMEGMIVPDLSASYKIWTKDETEFHEYRQFTFSDDGSRLMITVDKWKKSRGDSIHMGSDTMRVSYQYNNTCKLTLPYTSRDNVTNSTYYANGMLKMMKTKNCSYDFLDNVQRMVVKSFSYTGDPAAPHDIDVYECEYNSNHDLAERKIRYSGETGITIETYPQYQYDDMHNWVVRTEHYLRPGYAEPVEYATKRDFVYYP